MKSITQRCLLENNDHKLLHFSPSMASSFYDWYFDYTITFEEPPSVSDVIDEFVRLRIDEVKAKIVDSPDQLVNEWQSCFGSCDVDELANAIVDTEMVEDYSIYNGIVEDVYIHMNLSILCSGSEEGYVFNQDNMYAFPFVKDLQIIGAQVTLYYISQSTGAAYPLKD